VSHSVNIPVRGVCAINSIVLLLITLQFDQSCNIITCHSLMVAIKLYGNKINIIAMSYLI
jgi:hypothetical protein